MTLQKWASVTALALALAATGCREVQAPEQAPSPPVPEYSANSSDECAAAYGLRLTSEDPTVSHTGDYVIYIHGWEFFHKNCALWFAGGELTVPVGGSKVLLSPFNADEKGHELLLELERAGIADIADFRRFTYASFNKIERAAEALRAQLASFPAGSRVVLVGHSMGGLVARRAAQLMADDPSVEVIRIITLGTPHRGTEAAKPAFWPPLIESLSYLGLGTDGARDLRVNSTFLKDTLNSSSTPENRTIIYALAGDATVSYSCLHGSLYCYFLEKGWSQFASLGKASDAIVPTTSALGRGVLPLLFAVPLYDHLDLANGRGATSDPLLRTVAAYVDAAFRGSSASVKLTPRTDTLTMGSRIRLEATVRDESGNIIAGRPVHWQSSNPLVAAVDQNGIVTGISVGGPVTITARSDTRKPGTATITVRPAVLPPPGGAVGFDGHDDYISVPSSSRFNTAAITIEAWIKLDRDVTNEVRIISRESSDGTRYDWSLGLLADNYLIFDAERGGGSSGLRAASSVPLKAGFWHHVAAVATPDSVFLYLNGRSDTRIASPGALSTSSSPVFIGNGNPTLGRHLAFPGAIDEVRLWRVARGRTSIRASMSTVLTPPPNSLEAYWRFEEGSGPHAFSTGRTHTGTLSGAIWTASGEPPVEVPGTAASIAFEGGRLEGLCIMSKYLSPLPPTLGALWVMRLTKGGLSPDGTILFSQSSPEIPSCENGVVTNENIAAEVSTGDSLFLSITDPEGSSVYASWVWNGAGAIPVNPSPESVLATAHNAPSITDFTIAGNRIYYFHTQHHHGCNNQRLATVSITGGPVSVLAGNVHCPDLMVTDGAYVYWVSYVGGVGGTIARVPVGGGQVDTLATLLASQGTRFELDGDYLYFSSYVAGDPANVRRIRRISTAGGNVENIVTTAVAPRFAVANGVLYYEDNEPVTHCQSTPSVGRISKIAVSGGASTVLANGVQFSCDAGAMLVQGNTLYVVHGSIESVVSTIDIAGGVLTPRASVDHSYPRLFADGSYLYVNQMYEGGQIYRFNLADFTRSQLSWFSPQANLSMRREIGNGIGIGETGIYWTSSYWTTGNSPTMSIIRVPK